EILALSFQVGLFLLPLFQDMVRYCGYPSIFLLEPLFFYPGGYLRLFFRSLWLIFPALVFATLSVLTTLGGLSFLVIPSGLIACVNSDHVSTNFCFLSFFPRAKYHNFASPFIIDPVNVIRSASFR